MTNQLNKNKQTDPIPSKQKYDWKTEEEKDNTIDFVFGIEVVPKEFRNHKIWIKQWYKSNGDYVNKGELLCELEVEDLWTKPINVNATIEGYLEIFKQSLTESNEGYLQDKEKILSIHRKIDNQKAQELKAKRFENIPLVTADDFTGTKEIKWEVVAGRRPNYWYERGIFDSLIFFADNKNNDTIFFTINCIDNKDFAVFKCPTYKYKLTVGVTISFLFDNGEIINFKIVKRPYKHLDSYDSGHIFETKVPLTAGELEVLRNQELIKWQMEFPNSDRKIKGRLQNDTQYALRKLANDYFKLVQSEIENYQSLIDKNDTSIVKIGDSDECYVYLMIDLTTKYYKIGISNRPEYREKTLQSEKPTIEMLCNKHFPNRKMASSYEQALHQTYAEKRVRGEWFDLTDKEVKEVKEILIT